MTVRRLSPNDIPGPLAINPRAFFDLFPELARREAKVIGPVAVVEISGPLSHKAGGWFDSYDSISERVDQAIASNATTIALKINSPGGSAAGCMETARAIRAKCEGAGKQLVAYVDGMAASAAYALACAASLIAIPPSGVVGSIGVMHLRGDQSVADQAMGLRFTMISSSPSKGFDNPHVPITENEIAATQTVVNRLAGEFFALVQETRGVPTEKVAALDAQCFVGVDAISAGLADTVQSFDELLASIAAGATTSPKGSTMSKSYEDAIAGLRKAAAGDDDEAKKAKRMLAAELEDGDGDEGGSDAEGGDESGDDKEKDKDGSSASSGAGAISASAGATGATATGRAVGTGVTEQSRLDALEAHAREQFLATRPDLAAEFVAQLQTKPLAEVRALVNALPKAKAPSRAATATPSATRGQGQGTAGGTQPAVVDPEIARIDRMMGRTPQRSNKCEVRGTRMYMGPAPDDVIDGES